MGLYCWFVQTHYRKYKSLNSASNFPIIVMSLASFPGNEGREDGVYQLVELSDETDGLQLCQEIETVSVHIHISCHDVTARQQNKSTSFNICKNDASNANASAENVGGCQCGYFVH